MNKELALQLLKLLSGLESYAFTSEKCMPDYLFDDLISIVNELESIILDKPVEYDDFLTMRKGDDQPRAKKQRNRGACYAKAILQSVSREKQRTFERV